jgi:hypothetical protein
VTAAALAAPEALPLSEHRKAARLADQGDEPRPQLLEQALLACRTSGAGLVTKAPHGGNDKRRPGQEPASPSQTPDGQRAGASLARHAQRRN